MRLAGAVTDLHGLGRHDHVCWVYEELPHYSAAARRFLLDGLERGERLLSIGDVAIRSAVEQALVLTGEVDSFAVDRMVELLESMPVTGPTATLDISRLDFVDAAGACALNDWVGRLAARGIELRLHGARRSMRRVWSLPDLPADVLARAS